METLSSILLTAGGAITGTFGGIVAFILYRRKHSAEAKSLEIANEAKVREIYTPIIEDLRNHIEEENKRCAERLGEMAAELNKVKKRLSVIEVSCINNCFINSTD